MTADDLRPTARQADLDAALLLHRMGISAADLLASTRPRADVPTFAQYVPRVREAVSDGTRRVYGSYWNRILNRWADRQLDHVTPTDIKHLIEHTKAHTVARRNNRGGRSAAEHLVAALRCLYRHAEDDGLIDAADHPARKVAKPRRLPSTRQAVSDARLTEIHHAAATTGDDPALDTLLLRLHVETACRRGGVLALRPRPRSRPMLDLPTGEGRDGPLATGLSDAHGPSPLPRPRAPLRPPRSTTALRLGTPDPCGVALDLW